MTTTKYTASTNRTATDPEISDEPMELAAIEISNDSVRTAADILTEFAIGARLTSALTGEEGGYEDDRAYVISAQLFAIADQLQRIATVLEARP